MDKSEFEKASQFWIDKEKDLKRIENSKLMIEIDKFLEEHNTCALATASE